MSQRHQIFIVARISPRKSPSRVPPTANSPAQPQHGDDRAAAGASQQHLSSATKPPQTTKFPISNNPEYRCVFALHHQWHFGMTALGACYRLITSIRENAPAVAAELGTLDPVSWKNYGSNVWDQKRAATEETICPIIATLVSAVASWNPESGYLSQSTRFHPPWVHYCRSKYSPIALFGYMTDGIR